MRTYERYWWWVKEKKQMALVLFMIVTLMLQLQMKGCVGCLETERTGLLQLKSYLKNGFEVEEESMMKSWSHDDPSSDCCHWERVKCSDATGGHVVHLSLKDLILASYALENQSLNLSLLHSFPRLQSLDLSFNKFSDLFDPINGTVLVTFRESHPFILLVLLRLYYYFFNTIHEDLYIQSS
uniref:Leucine-rich repeat-containing N-terminal plant-type domain-containing protein n=1 Tax=Brassica oleracea var. oleracea TaxID=109376 RepID=A0A0D3DYL5_BRAOL